MSWWQILLIIAGAAILAVPAGMALGDLAAEKWVWPLARLRRNNWGSKAGVIGKYHGSKLIDSPDVPKTALNSGPKIAQLSAPNYDSPGIRSEPEKKVTGMTYTQQEVDRPLNKTEIHVNDTSGQSVNQALKQAAERASIARQERERLVEARAKREREAAEAAHLARIEQEKAASERTRLKQESSSVPLNNVEQVPTSRNKVVSEEEQKGKIAQPGAALINSDSQPQLYAEIRENLKIAAVPPSGKPARFHTSVWRNKTEDFRLSSTIVSNLNEAYTDMEMANNIVWLLEEVGASSADLKSSYAELCSKISERLVKVLAPS